MELLQVGHTEVILPVNYIKFAKCEIWNYNIKLVGLDIGIINKLVYSDI